jgi:hypothetical protein
MFIPDLGSDFFPSRIPDANCLYPGSASKNLWILTQKNCFWALGNMIPVVHPGFPIRILTLYPSRIPNPGVKKVPNPGSGSAKLELGKACEGNQNDAYNQSCWRNEPSLNRGLDRCRGLGLGEPFFLILAHTSKSTRPFKFCTNSGLVSPSSFQKWSRSSAIAFEEYTHPAQRPAPLNKLKLCGFWSLWAHLLNIWWEVRGHPTPFPPQPPLPPPFPPRPLPVFQSLYF